MTAKLMAGTALAALLALPGAAAAQQQQPPEQQQMQQQEQQPMPGQQQMGEQPTQMQPQVPGQQQAAQPMAPEGELTPARQVVDQTVQDQQGAEIGTVSHVAVDMDTGQILYALVERPDQPDQFTLIPWEAVSMPTQEGEPISAQVTAEQAGQAPTIQRQQLQDLTQPALRTQIIEHYALVAAAGQQPGQQQAMRLVLIGREAVQTLMSPPIATGESLRGAMVQTAQGEPLGEINEVILDPQHGRVAYVLVQRPEGQQAVRVPYAALNWQADRQDFALAGDIDPAQLPTAPLADTGMSRQQLGELYQEYGVQPYWQ